MKHNRRVWLDDDYDPSTMCERCKKQLIVVAVVKFGPLEMQVVRCENGHEYNRYRLLDVGQ